MINIPIILIGTRDQGQATGISQMFELVVKKFQKEKIPCFVVDLTLGSPSKKAGSLNIIRGVRLSGAILRYLSKLPFAKSVYLTVGVSRLGFFRDALILWPAILLKKKTVIHVHSGGYGEFYDSQSRWFKLIIRTTLSKVDRIIVLGELLREQFDFINDVSGKIKIVKNALPSGLVTDSSYEKQLDAKFVRLIFLSNMIESKGYLDILVACKILREEKKIPASVDFCGGFRSSVNDKQDTKIKSEDEFLKYVKQLKMEKFVKYHGIVSGIDKENLLKESDILILPTYYPSEGQPTCIIEALAYGIPVIATKYRGIPEEIIEDYNGYFVDPRSPRQIAEAVEKIFKNPEKYKELSKHAIGFYYENFTQDAHYMQIMPVLLGEK